MRKMSTAARDELVTAPARRYAVCTRAEKTRILDEFEAVTGFHRKHAMRVLRTDATRRHAEGRAGRRIYDDAVRDALVVLWEASDRICGKRLKALMPTLVEAMERHGHLKLGPDLRTGLLAMSAATVDRSLRKVREQAGGRRRRRPAAPSSVRLSIPVRTFSDWDDPAPGFAEADLVAHSGPVTRGSFVQTLVVTDIATGWIECAPVLYREQTLLREVLGEVRKLMPFELLGFDTDNDTVFINETLRDYCRDAGIVFTRCRPWRKNDQAFVEQKNGAVVRRIVGRRRPKGRGGAVAAVCDDEAVRQLLPAVVQAGVETAGRRARQQALPRAGDPEPAAPRRPEDACRRVRTRRRTDRHAGPDPAASADAGASAARRRHRRQADRGAGGRDRPSARAVPRRPADRLGGRRSEADGQAACETEARAAVAGSVGQGHGTVACVVRSRAVEHRPPTVRTPPGGASGRVPGRPSAHRAAAGQGLAQGKGDSDGVRRVAGRGVRRRRGIEPWNRGRVAGNVAGLAVSRRWRASFAAPRPFG